MTAQTAQVIYRGQHEQVNNVIQMLEDEIRLYESRLDMLQRMNLVEHQELLNTYRQMISVRARVRDDLKKIR